MPSTIVRPGRVALDTRKLKRHADLNLVRIGQLASAVAVVGRGRGLDMSPRAEIDAFSIACSERRPLVVSERRAALYAEVLGVDVADIAAEHTTRIGDSTQGST